MADKRQALEYELAEEATKTPSHKRTPEEREWREQREEQLESVSDLEKSLTGLDASGELSHIITVEDCDHCTGHAHTPRDYRCRRDILYCNLNKALIAALLEFRASYFGNEEFLSKPFRRDELDAAWTFGC